MRNLLVISCASLSLLLVSCAKKPEDTVRTFLDASKKGEKEKALACLVEKEREGKIAWNPAGPKKGAEATFTVGESRVDGDKAKVGVTIRSGKQEQKLEFVLVKEKGEWRVSLEQTLGPMFEFMKKGMEKMMKGMGEAFKKGMKDTMKGMGKAMKEGMEEAAKKGKKTGK